MLVEPSSEVKGDVIIERVLALLVFRKNFVEEGKRRSESADYIPKPLVDLAVNGSPPTLLLPTFVNRTSRSAS